MGKGRTMVLIGKGDGRAPTPNSAEAAAFEYFHNRASLGNYAPRPTIQKWRADDRERFLAELRRLETQHERNRVLAVEQAGERSDEQFRSRT